jgi:putative hydrolase of the HAD superfamily
MKIKGLIFDFDGLILDTEQPILQSWQELYKSYNCHLSFDDWATTIGSTDAAFDPGTELEEQLGQRLDWETIEPKRSQREMELILKLPPLPGVCETLDAAKESGLRIGLASSSQCSWVTGHLSRLGLIQYFDCIIASDDVSCTKPDPELFMVALSALRLNPDQAIVFEDSRNGILAAKRAGIFTVAVPNALTCNLPLDEADMHLGSLAEIPLGQLLQMVETAVAERPSAKI